jgi:hypothetical protein
MTSSLAVVLLAGQNARIGGATDGESIKTGDIVKLQEYKTETVVSGDFEAMMDNEQSDSNLIKVSKHPKKYETKVNKYFGEYRLCIDPLKVTRSSHDFFTFALSSSEIVCSYEPKTLMI